MEFSGSGISDTCVLWMRHDGVLSRYSDYLGDMTYRHIGSWSPVPPAANTTSSVILSLHVPVVYRNCSFCNSSRMNQTSFNKLFQYQSDAVTALCLSLKTKDNSQIWKIWTELREHGPCCPQYLSDAKRPGSLSEPPVCWSSGGLSLWCTAITCI